MWGESMPTSIIPCGCENAYQDKRYGNGMRVHNQMPNAKPGMTSWRCTVCLSTKERGAKKPDAA